MKLLVVDDDELMREHLMGILRHEGFEVLSADNGQLGLEIARQEIPDLVLSDIMMPELDGYGMLKALRADPLTAGIPFIFLTASTNRMDRRRGMNLGADDYIGKPFSHEEVRDAVWARLKRSQPFERSDAPLDPTPNGLIPFSGYRVVRRLGGGGMSEVFLAIRERDGQEVALKLLDTRHNQDDSLLPRFLQECALLEQIKHTNVARIFDHGLTDTHAFIAMEYFEEGDIRKRIAAGLSPYAALAIIVQVAMALSQIHALGIVHRDVKPDNLMMRSDGSVALIDFGVAKLSDQQFDQTQHGEIVGSPYYMSPEQALGQPVSPASDIYCLGVIFYEMVTGKRPYSADVMESLLYQHVNAPRPQFEAKFADFQGLLDRMMHKSPAKRFASGQAVVDFVTQYWPPVIKRLKGKSLPAKPG